METVEEGDNGERAVSELRSELWEKERKLTDIRLEALSSAHQLEQLREAMNNMQSTVDNLKAENDHLKTGSQLPLSGPGPTSSTSQPSGLASLLGPSVNPPISMSLTKSFSLSLNDCKAPDVSSCDLISVSSQYEEVCAKILVRTGDQMEDSKQLQEFYLGSVTISPRTNWTSLDSLIAKTFQLNQGVQRTIGGGKPQVLPHQCLDNGPIQIFVTLKVLSGPSGTGKTYLAQHLAHYLLQCSQIDSLDSDHESCVLGRSPCFFLSCPVSVAEFRQWFIDLWNHSIIPYLQEGAKDGIKHAGVGPSGE
ncbi:hypothetical protein GOODEAATRI_002191 [Goodea atripinnis]|uniref:Neuron navigator 1 n=1 Tax=Goodea atripinnis TaxID=208336 RepID=A0ABV0MY05_9TELE